MPRPLPIYHKSFLLAKMTLRTSRNKTAAVHAIITRDKLPEAEARTLVDDIYDQTVSSNKTNGFFYLLGGGALFALFYGVYLFTGRVYFILLPMFLASALKGGYDMFLADGFE